jgi:hypothetical protein
MSQEAPVIVVDPTEYAAVATLLRAVIATMAEQQEMSRPGGGQAWINLISEACQGAISGHDAFSDFPVGANIDVDAFRRKAMEHVNRMLTGLAPKAGPAKPNN